MDYKEVGMSDLTISELSWRLSRIDHHMVRVLAMRVGKGSLSEAVAQAKRSDKKSAVFAIKNPKREEERLAMVETWAKRYGLDPNYAAAVLVGIIAESCKIQAMFMHDHQGDDPSLDLDNPEVVKQYYLDHLLQLTARIAPTYDEQYANDLFGSEAYIQFERGEIAKAIDGLEDTGLALDLGCATGQHALRLGKAFDKVVGYDISPDMLVQAEKAKKAAGANGNVSFNLSDLEFSLPEKDSSVSFVVMSLGTASDIRNLDGLLAEIRRILKPGGRFALSFYNSNSLLAQIGFCPWPVPLAAMVDQDRHCLEVHIGTELFEVYARSYSVAEVRAKLDEQGLSPDKVFTHPTVSSILPDDLFSTELFHDYDEGIKDTRRLGVTTKIHEKPDTTGVKNSLRQLDESLATSPLEQGAYILVIGGK
jgi:SAM-dependent methyltransferase/chorismate mutase